jgi:hypothetical protein
VSKVCVVEMYGLEEGAHTPIAVEPSLMASSEYSTWKRRPSGEKVLYACELVNSTWDTVGFLT